jgi:TonB family protein
MRKRALFFLPVAAILVLLSGCIVVRYEYGHGINLNRNGSGNILVAYRICPNYEFSVTERSIRGQYSGAPFRVRNVDVEAVGTTTEVSYVLDFDRVTDLNGWGDFGEEGADFKHTFYHGRDGNEQAFRETVTLRIDEEYLPFLDGYFFYKVSVPGEIIKTNGRIEEDGVTWRYSANDISNKTRTMYVIYETGLPTWLWVALGAVILIVLLVVVAGAVVVIVIFVRRKKKVPPVAEPVPDTSLAWPEEAEPEIPPVAPTAEPPPRRVEPRPEGPRAAPPPARERPKRKLKPVGCIILIVVAAVLLVVVLVAAFFVTDYYGVNPLTEPYAEEEPAGPPGEVEAQPPAPKAQIKFTVLQVIGGGRTAAGVGKDLAGKAESISRVIGSKGAGEVELELSISSGGNVVRAKILRSTYKDAMLESKIAYAARGWKFAAATGTTRARVKIAAK